MIVLLGSSSWQLPEVQAPTGLQVSGVPANIVITQGQSYDFSQHVSGGNQPYSFEVTQGTLPTGVTLDADTGVLSASVSATIGTTSDLKISVTDTATSADADWLARSTAAGVIWAHDFSSPLDPNGTNAEFRYFLRSSVAPYEGSTLTNPIDNSTDPLRFLLKPYLVPTQYGNSRAIRSEAAGTYLTSPVVSAPTGTHQVWNVADPSKFPDPAVYGAYHVICGVTNFPWEGPTWNGGIEYIRVHAIDYTAKTMEVERRSRATGATTPPDYPADPDVMTIGYGPSGRWNRPLAALPAGDNGLAVDDIGVSRVTGAIMDNTGPRKVRSWNGLSSAQHGNFRESFFCHQSYHSLYDNYTTIDGKNLTEIYEGDEYYIQFRARISGSRFDTTNPLGKMFFMQNCHTSNLGQVFWVIGPQAANRTVPDDWPYGPAGNACQPSIGYGDSRQFYGGTVGHDGQTNSQGALNFQYHDPAVYPDAYITGSHVMKGWCFPADKWVTYLFHFKLGRDSAVKQIHQANLTVALPYTTTQDAVTIHVDDASGFADPSSIASGRIWVGTCYKDGSGNRYDEWMRITSIDYVNNTLTGTRNNYKRWSYNPDGWAVGTKIVYGAYDQYPGFIGEPIPPAPGSCVEDPNQGYRESTFELYVCVEGAEAAGYERIISNNQIAWMWGQTVASYLNSGDYYPPGLGNIEIGQNLNDYVGSGSVRPPNGAHHVEYTQVIFSKQFIPCPTV